MNTVREWTLEEIRNGRCEYCGGPRITKVAHNCTEIMLLLVCSECGREAS